MKYLRLLIAFLFLLPLFAQTVVYPAPRIHKTINVGYLACQTAPDSPGHLLSLYSRRFLSEIARQTDWQYVFIPVPAGQALDMLRSGAIDLYYPAPEYVHAPGFLQSEGFAAYALFSLYGSKNDTTTKPGDPSTLSGRKIGRLAAEGPRERLDQFLLDQELLATVKEYPDTASLLDAFTRGDIDFFLLHENPIPDRAQKAFSIAIEPATFLTTEENGELMKKLSDNILAIERANPTFETRLEKNYYDNAQAAILYYNAAEQSFMDSAPRIRFAIPQGPSPCFEDDERGGILPDILEDVHHASPGLSFDYVRVPTAKEGFDMLANGEVDAVFCVYSNTDWAQDFYISNSFTFLPMTLIVRQDMLDPPSEPRIVLPDWFVGTREYLAAEHPNWNISVLTSPEDCSRALQAKEYDAALVPSWYLQKTALFSRYPELKSWNGQNISLPISIAIAPQYPDAKLLQGILSTATLKIAPSRIDDIVTKHLAQPMDFWDLIRSHANLFNGAVAFVILVAILLFLSHLRNHYNKRLAKALFEQNIELERALIREKELRQSRDSYKRQAETDALTGLYDKAAMVRLAREVLEDPLEGDAFHALFVLDLDHFKELNDTYGHQAGDKALIDFANGLKSLFRASDYMARFGGDEFVILMTNLHELKTLADRARAILSLAKSIPQPDGKHILTASIGIATAPQDGTSYDELFAAADAALYKVKRDGRGNYRIA